MAEEKISIYRLRGNFYCRSHAQTRHKWQEIVKKITQNRQTNKQNRQQRHAKILMENIRKQIWLKNRAEIKKKEGATPISTRITKHSVKKEEQSRAGYKIVETVYRKKYFT
ncbi:hypothetical protein C2G38_2217536 [Gigaspora rosea]|uniref:Uncharacterized protein n=1 Tax=Gigaspora rosea TaxID=44941 RepID=A0A397U7L1_9GLOM|nr:hypothetical protein C2G38_2217536 [Gigaspora rosea]